MTNNDQLSTSNLYIHSIFRATEGEGLFIGTPQIFVRFQGCDVGCVNCDTKETWAFSAEYLMSVEDVLKQVAALKLKRVSITGGEPIHERNRASLLVLMQALRERGYFINIEVSGCTFDKEVFALADFIGLDYKTPSTKVSKNKGAFQLGEVIAQTNREFPIPHKLQVKCVISDENDFFQVLHLRERMLEEGQLVNVNLFSWVLTPAYNLREEFPLARFEMILRLNELHGGLFRVIGQQHKWVYGPDRRNV